MCVQKYMKTIQQMVYEISLGNKTFLQTLIKVNNDRQIEGKTRLHKSRSSRDELEFDLSNFV